MALLFILLVVNFGISWFNAYSVGRSWADSKAIGGWPRLLAWCAGIMSASGFTWIYLTILTMMAGAAGLLEPRYVKVALELGYVIIIGPVLGSGLAITIDSWTTAIREKSTLGYGVAAWNTFAQVHNTYEAISLLPDIIDDLSDTLSGDGDSDNAGPAVLVLLIVLFALAGGAFTTAAIVRHTAREYAVDVRRAAKAA